MAGTYPDVPAPKIQYDEDGTIVSRFDSALTWQEDLSQSSIDDLDDYDEAAVTPEIEDGYYIFFFPRAVDIEGLLLRGGGTDTDLHNDCAWSADTTNGDDGTWTTVTGLTEIEGPTGRDPLRDSIDDVSDQSITGAVALRIKGHSTNTFDGRNKVRNVHIYGRPSSGTNQDRLELWHPTTDEAASGAHFDIGDVNLSSEETVDFRVKNLSSTYDATGISIDPLDSADVEFDGGSGFVSSLDLGTLTPGEVSSVITVRRNVPASAGLGWWEFAATVDEWQDNS